MTRSGDTTKPEINIPADLLVRCPKLTPIEPRGDESQVSMGDFYSKATNELLEMYIKCATKDDKLINAAQQLQEAYNRQK